jgi:hypothetical protein
MEKATHLMTVRKGGEREERERERDQETDRDKSRTRHSP